MFCIFKLILQVNRYNNTRDSEKVKLQLLTYRVHPMEPSNGKNLHLVYYIIIYKGRLKKFLINTYSITWSLSMSTEARITSDSTIVVFTTITL